MHSATKASEPRNICRDDKFMSVSGGRAETDVQSEGHQS